MSRAKTTAMASVLVMTLLSGLTMAVPLANAQSTVMVSIPSGAGSPNGAPGYSPDKVKVVMGINNTVTWTNNDNAHHTVTSVPGNGSISSGDLAPAASYSFTFTAPGTYNYTCSYHKWMVGYVVVLAGSTSTSTTTKTTPEFPAAWLAVILFAVIAAAVAAAPRFRASRVAAPSV